MDPVTAEQSVACNLPNEPGHWSLSIYSTLEVTGSNGTVYVARNRDSGRIYSRNALNGMFFPWLPIPTATPPQQFDLPLAEGVTSYGISKYCKTQENIVIVNFAVVFADVKTGSGSYLFANLPSGFRPNGVIVTSAGSWCESPLNRNAVECDVRQDGGIYISTTEQSIQYVHGQVVFVAA